MKSFEFFFDFISPFGYLASLRVDPLAEKYGLIARWQPVLIGVSVLKVMGMKPLLDTPLKGGYLKRDIERYHKRHGITTKRQPGDPVANPVPCARAFHWLDRHHPQFAKPFAKAVFDAYWQNGVDIGSVDAASDIAESIGAKRVAVREGIASGGEGDKLLRAAVDNSLKRGVFGSPFFIVDGEPFFGLEKMELLEEWIAKGGW